MVTHTGSLRGPGEDRPTCVFSRQLHLIQEGSAGTPIDQYLTDENGAFELLAPKGTYLLRWWSPDERVIGERPMTLRTEPCQIDLPLSYSGVLKD